MNAAGVQDGVAGMAVARWRLWFGLFGGAVAWTLRLLISYPLVPVACSSGTSAGLHTVTALAVVMTVAAGAIAHGNAQRAAPSTAARFMGRIGLILNGLFLLSILAEGAVPLFHDPCLGVTLGQAAPGARAVAGWLLTPAGAHAAHGPIGGDAAIVQGFPAEAVTVTLLASAAWIYARGAARLRGRRLGGRAHPAWRMAAFAAGVSAIAIAVLSPLDTLAAALFSAHMVQHLALTMLAAPLLVLGAPLVPALWALPLAARQGLARWWHRRRALRAAWGVIAHPLVAAAVHAIALWTWHVPAVYEAALADPVLHLAEHAAFLSTAALFWWALVHAGRSGGAGYGVALLAVFATSLLSTGLGALITFASLPWYPAHAVGAAAHGLSLLEDQQLAGVIMWAPAGLLHVAAAAALFAAWLRVAERRVRAREAIFDASRPGVHAHR